MSGSDPWNATDRQDEVVLDAMAQRLEARGANPFFQGMLDDYVGAMAIDGARSVLDMGCGTGIASRRIAARTGFAGCILGIDLSPYLVEIAARLAHEEGTDEKVRFEAGDTHSLALGDTAFDAVVANTLLSHVSDPLAVLGEAKRVARPGGMIGVFDGDYASMTFGQADAAKAKRDDERIIDAVVTQPRVMR